MSKLFEEGEGGAVVGSSNVTTAVAMRQPPLPPEKRQKSVKGYEEAIDQTIEVSAKKKLQEVLSESIFRLRDRVEVEGKKGKVTATTKVGNADHVQVEFEDGTFKTYDPKKTTMKVTRQGSQFDMLANAHFKDAQVAKRQVQRGRMHDSTAKGHAALAKHHEWEGDKGKAAEHQALSDEHAKKAKEAFGDAQAGKGQFIDKYELRRNESNAQRKRADAIKHAPKYTYHHYYNVPFSEKDKAKAAGLKWDPNEKKWYVGSEMRHHVAHGKQPWKFAHTYDNAFRKKHDD